MNAHASLAPHELTCARCHGPIYYDWWTHRWVCACRYPRYWLSLVAWERENRRRREWPEIPLAEDEAIV
uniref:Uncharacterized protein n=1 Tax=viral metagenome TaxID=1070528 RepID=A0A6M3LN51_9ZZZZ